MAATIVSEFPRSVREIENTWIPMADGTKIAARIWLPVDASDNPVPAILEYIPYRKRDYTAYRDEDQHPYVAGHGYAIVRADIRGAGDSDGILDDEYTLQEHEDGLEILAWMRAQPWCDGNLGMMGISWGGFNSLQIAARQPQGLKAVIAVGFTDDRYNADVHYAGGCMLFENPSWDAQMFVGKPLPPDPLLVGDRWRDMWFARMEAGRPWISNWAGHQHRDDYWKHGSVIEDYDAIECAVLAVNGWEDGYVDPVFTLCAAIGPERSKGIMGPWCHNYPYDCQPGPTIGWLQECVRWWDYWLKGVANDVMAGPHMRAWMQDWEPPKAVYETHPGRWVGEDIWPSPRIESSIFFLNHNGLSKEPVKSDEEMIVRPMLSSGLETARWCGYGSDHTMPRDQRPDDALWLTFDSDPLDESFEMLGAPGVTLHFRVDQPVAQVALRLCDVAPDGSSLRVSFGLKNLNHLDGQEHPQTLQPGEDYTIDVPLRHMGHVFGAGHRIRLAVQTSYFPVIWPSPAPVTLSLKPGESSLRIPVRPTSPDDALMRAFDPPVKAAGVQSQELRAGATEYHVTRKVDTGESIVSFLDDHGRHHLQAIDLEWEEICRERMTIRGEDPLSTRFEAEHYYAFARGDWAVSVTCHYAFWCSAEHFHYKATLEGREGETSVFTKEWDGTIPRNHM